MSENSKNDTENKKTVFKDGELVNVRMLDVGMKIIFPKVVDRAIKTDENELPVYDSDIIIEKKDEPIDKAWKIILTGRKFEIIFTHLDSPDSPMISDISYIMKTNYIREYGFYNDDSGKICVRPCFVSFYTSRDDSLFYIKNDNPVYDEFTEQFVMVLRPLTEEQMAHNRDIEENKRTSMLRTRRWNPTAKDLLNKASENAKRHGYGNVTPEHYLKEILVFTKTADFFKEVDFDLPYLIRRLDAWLIQNSCRRSIRESKKEKFRNWINDYFEENGNFRDNLPDCLKEIEELKVFQNRTTAFEIFSAIYGANCMASLFLKEAGFGCEKLISQPVKDSTYLKLYKAAKENWESFNAPVSDSDFEEDTRAYERLEMLESQGVARPEDMQAKLMLNPLKSFTTNLTEEAEEGRLMPVIGHDVELSAMIQTLCRKTKCNPILVGDSGVGKTSIVEGLAQKIVEGKVPESLKTYEIFSLDLTSLLAGCCYHGMMEERVQGVINAVSERANAILYIDEIHTIVGAGVNNVDEMGVSNILKPSLARGKIKCIGSTTLDEYNRRFERDKALNRRFQKIDVVEPSKTEAFEILKGILPKYQDFYDIECDEETLLASIDLSVCYLPEKKLPDKAIDLLDEAFAYAKLHSEQEISAETVKKIVSKITSIPLENMDNDEESGLKNLAAKIETQIFGQNEAVEKVVQAVKKARSGFKNPEKPDASFLFVGSTGVGKTELCRVLAKELNENFLRFDMSEYQEEHSVSKLIGSPFGYHDSEEGGVLTKSVHRNPHSIILFDEIEKAHPNIYNLFLQILDYGTLTDSRGEKVDFRNCLIIMTSNVGLTAAGEYKSLGFGRASDGSDEKARREIINNEIEKTFSPEFRNRLDEIVMFNPINQEIAKDIARREVRKIAERLESKKVHVTVTEAYIEKIVNQAYSKEYGGRNIAKVTEKMLGEKLIDEILFGSLKNGGDILLDVIE